MKCLVLIMSLAIGLLLASWHWHSAASRESLESDLNRRSPATNTSSETYPGTAEIARTKSRIRPNHPQPTIEKTTQLIRTTIIPLLDFPTDQPLPERIARVNELIQKAGVESRRLRVILRSADPAIQWRSKGELRIREVPLGIALKYLCDSTKLRYHIRENGIVELTSIREEESLPDLPNLPEIKKPSPSGETDAFGNDPNTPAETDPIDLPIPIC
jgi:hypothetical protein